MKVSNVEMTDIDKLLYQRMLLKKRTHQVNNTRAYFLIEQSKYPTRTLFSCESARNCIKTFEEELQKERVKNIAVYIGGFLTPLIVSSFLGGMPLALISSFCITGFWKYLSSQLMKTKMKLIFDILRQNPDNDRFLPVEVLDSNNKISTHKMKKLWKKTKENVSQLHLEQRKELEEIKKKKLTTIENGLQFELEKIKEEQGALEESLKDYSSPCDDRAIVSRRTIENFLVSSWRGNDFNKEELGNKVFRKNKNFVVR